MTSAGENNDDIVLVGEYALHLLDAKGRLTFEKRLANEPDLRVLLREWNEGLIPMAEEVKLVLPPARVKFAITSRLFPEELAPKQSRFGWLPAIFAVLAIVVLGVLFGPDLLNRQNGTFHSAEIAAQDRTLVVTARFDPDTAVINIERLQGAALPGRALELWLIANDTQAPVSLGVLPITALSTVAVPEELRARIIGGTLAISDEPLGGSTSGVPTGAVLAVGAVVPS